MGQYGDAAVKAVCLLEKDSKLNPEGAWKNAMKEVSDSESSINKGCPKTTFLSLCQEGFIKNVHCNEKKYTYSNSNYRYTMNAVKMLLADEKYLENRPELWQLATAPDIIFNNGQMDVLITLWEEEKIDRQAAKRFFKK
ncbi:MAG: hypothetical protein MI802_18940 [Desulfobacterales bacterium]|nr:hypothetical protein [Desulfobacterales bacterium]